MWQYLNNSCSPRLPRQTTDLVIRLNLTFIPLTGQLVGFAHPVSLFITPEGIGGISWSSNSWEGVNQQMANIFLTFQVDEDILWRSLHFRNVHAFFRLTLSLKRQLLIIHHELSNTAVFSCIKVWLICSPLVLAAIIIIYLTTKVIFSSTFVTINSYVCLFFILLKWHKE